MQNSPTITAPMNKLVTILNVQKSRWEEETDKLFQVTKMEKKKVRKLKWQHYNCYYFCTFQQPLLEAQKEREQ